MAFGFPAYHEETIRLPRPLTQQLLVDACAMARFAVMGPAKEGPLGLEWRLSSDMSLASWGEKIVVIATGPDTAFVRSQCALPTQCIDWGRNRKNVRRLIEALENAMRVAELLESA